MTVLKITLLVSECFDTPFMLMQLDTLGKRLVELELNGLDELLKIREYLEYIPLATKQQLTKKRIDYFC